MTKVAKEVGKAYGNYQTLHYFSNIILYYGILACLNILKGCSFINSNLVHEEILPEKEISIVCAYHLLQQLLMRDYLYGNLILIILTSTDTEKDSQNTQ